MVAAFAIESECFNSVDHLKIMTTEPIAPSSIDILSNYRGSENTRQKVEAQILERYGAEAASAYDPLTNCFPFRLWLKKGFVVRKGEKALQSMTFIEKKDAQGHVIGKYPKKVFLFFKTQVEPLKGSSPTRYESQ